ncbi:ferredoxin-type protein NapF [Roseibium sp.]|uniref:ferredoxin-type protein NapF n=2 Tax=Roseibium sp. TaxID=1936156 RepID=UPI003C7D7285
MTTPNPSRRNFLRGNFRATESDVMRPPGAVPDFDRVCTECGDCVSACPEGILVNGPDKRPLVDFDKGACTFCVACVEACPSGALNPETAHIWDWRAEVSEGCLSMQGVTCRTCEDVCEPQAIRFRLAKAGKSYPVIDLNQCSGCGACAHSCPASAISFEKHIPSGKGQQ